MKYKAALWLVVLSLALESRAQTELAPECEYAPDGPSELVVGLVECLRFDSEMMGGKAPFSYYIPPACDPALGRRCPVLYYLHGLGGTYQSGQTDGLGMRGQADAPWVRALTSGPPVDPRAEPEPWLWWEPSTWVPEPAVDVILVTPHGQTLPGGHGPSPDQPKSTGWADFNPRYAQGGEQELYDTPPPRNASMILYELIPYVEAHFPVIPDRSGRALGGLSYGSIGTGHIGLTHPDFFSSLQMISGVGVPWPPACVVDPGGAEVASPLEFPFFVGAPGVQPLVEALIDPPLIFIGNFGDGLGLEYAYARAHHPPDLLPNARAFAGGQQVLRLGMSVNDSVPRRGEDVTDPIGTPIAAGLELALSFTPGQEMHAEADLRGVEHIWEEGPGTHSHPYWQPYMRKWLESMYAAVRHWDGTGNVYPDPDVFDYRTISTDFSVWGWEFQVERQALEFLNLRDVSCDAVTLRGTGVVTFTVPLECGTGVGGSREVTVDLGPSIPTNEPLALGLCESYGHVETVALEDLDGDGLTGAADNCPHVSNPGQEDDGGIATDVSDGIGNACQCGDVTGQGIVNGQDGVLITRFGLGYDDPLFVMAGNCDVTGNGACNGQDGHMVTREALGLAPNPLFGQRCPNADPTTPCLYCP